MISDIKDILVDFDPVSLEEMDCVRLMDRVDTKYVLSARRVIDLLAVMEKKYRVLTINNENILSYDTNYFDTPDYLFFYNHVTGRSVRNKVRFRLYKSTGVSFLEIKKKTKKDRTIKWRIENTPSDKTFDTQAQEFLNTYINCDPETLKPVVRNTFKRITLTGINFLERITIDFDMSFLRPDGKKADIPFIAIAELKSNGLPAKSPFSNLIRQLSVHPTGFSKYCVGTVLLNDLPHKNILKPKILLLNKIENEHHRFIYA